MSRERPLPTEKQIGVAFRQLADDYSDELAKSSKNRAWQRIELRRSMRRKQGSGLASRLFALRLLGVGLAAALAVTVAAVAFWPSGGSNEFRVVGGSLEKGWLTTTVSPAQVDFSDGSHLNVAADSSLSINVLGRHSALTRLARGSVQVKVKHHDDTNWTFLAGPYEVRVEGTAFDLRWADEQLDLLMHEGQVRVVASGQREWLLHKGERLVLPPESPRAAGQVAAGVQADSVSTELPSLTDEGAGRAAALGAAGPGAAGPSAAGSSAAGSSAGASNAGAGGGNTSLGAVSGTATSPGAEESAAAKSWNQLITEGRFAEIVADAERSGVQRVLTSRSSSELVALGQAARYVGQAALAESSWKAVRSRSPGSSDAQQSAFFLGRIMEQQGRSAEAVSWFDRYRAESPSGVYAGQALGRQLVLSGKTAAARNLAREYLARFPDGPYAGAAQVVLQDSAGPGAPSGPSAPGQALSKE
jgi:hypothetical protein